MVYATGIFRSVTPDSSVKEGTMAMVCSVTSLENGFSGCEVIVSTGFSSRSNLGDIVGVMVRTGR